MNCECCGSNKSVRCIMGLGYFCGECVSTKDTVPLYLVDENDYEYEPED